MKTLLLKLLLISMVPFCLCACNGNQRLVSKFVKRMNAHRVNAASKYIYPADYAGLYFFNKEIFEKSPNTLIKIQEQKKDIINGQQCIIVKLECTNVSPFFRNYMNNLGLLNNNDVIIDTLFIRETDKGKCLSFDWTKIKGENLKLAAIADTTVSNLNIRSGTGTNYPVVGKLEKSKKVVIDEYSNDSEWVKCFTVDDQCNIVQGYINRTLLKSQDTLFFPLGIFGSLGVLMAVIILVIIAFPLIFIRSIVSLLNGIPVVGIILSLALILGLLYAVYELLDSILFETFLINLPKIL